MELSNNLLLIKYEMRRLILMKKNLLLLPIFFYMVWQSFNMSIEMGKYCGKYFALNTSWGYAWFLSTINCFLLTILIFLCISIYSTKEKRARELILTTPLSAKKYYIIKWLAVLLSFLGFLFIVIVLSFILSIKVYEIFNPIKWILPVLIYTIPSAVIISGVSIAIGRINEKILYFLIPLIIYMGMRNFLDLPNILDICGNDMFIRYWEYIIKLKHVGIVERGFKVPTAFLYSRFEYGIIGVLVFSTTFLFHNVKISAIFKKRKNI